MYRVTFFLGIERDGAGKQLPPEVRADGMARVREILAVEYGGYTLTHAAGGWTNGEGVIVEEAAVRLDCYFGPEAKLPSRADVDATARRLGAMLGQDAVLVDWARTDSRMVRVSA